MSGYFARMAQLARSTPVLPTPKQAGAATSPPRSVETGIPKQIPNVAPLDTPQPLGNSQSGAEATTPAQQSNKTNTVARKLDRKISHVPASIETKPAQTLTSEFKVKEAFQVLTQPDNPLQNSSSATSVSSPETTAEPAPPPTSQSITHQREGSAPLERSLPAGQPAMASTEPINMSGKKFKISNKAASLPQKKIPNPAPVSLKTADVDQQSTTPTNGAVATNANSPQSAINPDPVQQEETVAPPDPAPGRENGFDLSPVAGPVTEITPPPVSLPGPNRKPSFEVNIGSISMELGPDRENTAPTQPPANPPRPVPQHTGIWSGSRVLARNYIRGY